MISPELLSEVFNVEVEKYYINENRLHIETKDKGYIRINIHELAHKCKEWAFMQWYDIESSIDHEFDENENHIWLGFAYLGHMKDKEQTLDRRKYKEFEAKSEPEAIFKACEWILNARTNTKDLT